MEALKNFTEQRQRLVLTNDLNNWVPGGYFGCQVTGVIDGLFLGLKFSIPVFFGLGKF